MKTMLLTPFDRSHRLSRFAAARLTAAAAALAITVTVAPGAAAADAPPACTGTPLLITADCVDPTYAQPVIDSETDVSAPVLHRKVSGHFEGTDIQFTIYLPPADQWEGRFFQYTYPTAFTPEENTAVASDQEIGSALTSGAYLVRAGNAGLSLGYRHAAAAAKFAEGVAADYYGTSQEITGYLTGGSGGSYQTIGAAEGTAGVWEGFVPWIQAVPMSLSLTFFIRSMARLVLLDKAEQISDAVLPGGSGDPYAGLDAAEQAMLRELTSYGVPLRAWENADYLLGIASAQDGTIQRLDPTYVTDFWTKDGYLGTEDSPLGDVVRAALQEMGDTPENRWDLALRSYYRHQLPPVQQGYTGFDQFRDTAGEPLYPQRAFVIPPLISGAVSGGAAYDGDIGDAKMIAVNNLYDVDALPVHADWYAGKVRAALGEQEFADSYRIYYNDHADHVGAPAGTPRATSLVNYNGMVEQALRDVAAWAEDGITPPRSSQYTVTDNQVDVPDRAKRRGGIQPTVDLTVRGRESVTVRVGEAVRLRADVEAVPGTGEVVEVAWDLQGTGTYTPDPLRRPKRSVQAKQEVRFDQAGVYYVGVRATVQRDGIASPYAQVPNLDRVRVVVTEKRHHGKG